MKLASTHRVTFVVPLSLQVLQRARSWSVDRRCGGKKQTKDDQQWKRHQADWEMTVRTYLWSMRSRNLYHVAERQSSHWQNASHPAVPASYSVRSVTPVCRKTKACNGLEQIKARNACPNWSFKENHHGWHSTLSYGETYDLHVTASATKNASTTEPSPPIHYTFHL